MQKSSRCHRVRGFTLIELMIAIVIISILAVVAYPAYQDQVRRARRGDGKATLLDVAQRLERCYTRFGRYDDANCNVALPLSSAEGFYTVSAVGAITSAAFTLAATPQNVQVGDTRCGVLRLTSTGQQGSQDQDDDANDCW
ncbi:MAG TPA: type IV pilin protein [Gammaproteobacteria bacterium]